jgi:hypothetical protein
VARKNTDTPIKKKGDSKSQDNNPPAPPRRWWQAILETNKIIAASAVASVVVVALVGKCTLDEMHEGNVATHDQNRARLVVAVTPPAKVIIKENGENTLDLYIADIGPSEAKNVIGKLRIGEIISGRTYFSATIDFGPVDITPSDPYHILVENPSIIIPPIITFLSPGTGWIVVQGPITFDTIYMGEHFTLPVDLMVPCCRVFGKELRLFAPPDIAKDHKK